MDLTLYRVGTNGRVTLGDLAGGVEFYTVAKADDADGATDGTLTLTPVRVVSPTAKRTLAGDQEE